MNEIPRELMRPQLVRIPPDARIGIHPAVTDLAAAADVSYLAADLSPLAPVVARYLALMEPVIVATQRGRYLVIGGLRTWEVVRRLAGQSSLLAIALPGQMDPDAIRKVTLFDCMVRRLLTSLACGGAHQIDAMARLWAPGYVRPAPGRPVADELPQGPGPLDPFFRSRLTTGLLARITNVAPSTLRRARGGDAHG